MCIIMCVYVHPHCTKPRITNQPKKSKNLMCASGEKLITSPGETDAIAQPAECVCVFSALSALCTRIENQTHRYSRTSHARMWPANFSLERSTCLISMNTQEKTQPRQLHEPPSVYSTCIVYARVRAKTRVRCARLHALLPHTDREQHVCSETKHTHRKMQDPRSAGTRRGRRHNKIYNNESMRARSCTKSTATTCVAYTATACTALCCVYAAYGADIAA